MYVRNNSGLNVNKIHVCTKQPGRPKQQLLGDYLYSFIYKQQKTTTTKQENSKISQILKLCCKVRILLNPVEQSLYDSEILTVGLLDN